MPWVESPFFHKLIEKLDIPKYKVELAKEFNAKGYVIIQLGLTKTFIEDLINEINRSSWVDDKMIGCAAITLTGLSYKDEKYLNFTF